MFLKSLLTKNNIPVKFQNTEIHFEVKQFNNINKTASIVNNKEDIMFY